MKKLLLSLTCGAALVASVRAESLQPRTARHVLIGGVVGAIIGENNDKPLEGAAIGAAAGLIWSAATQRDCEREYAPPARSSRECREPARTVVITQQPVCRPQPRTVVVVKQAPQCGTERVVVVKPSSHRHRGHRHNSCEPQVIYLPAERHCDDSNVVVYDERRGGYRRR